MKYGPNKFIGKNNKWREKILFDCCLFSSSNRFVFHHLITSRLRGFSQRERETVQLFSCSLRFQLMDVAIQCIMQIAKKGNISIYYDVILASCCHSKFDWNTYRQWWLIRVSDSIKGRNKYSQFSQISFTNHNSIHGWFNRLYAWSCRSK